MFSNANVQRLWKRIGRRDQELFNFNMKSMDWVDYSYHYIKGMRIYLFKDGLQTLDAARKKWNRYVNVACGPWCFIEYSCSMFFTNHLHFFFTFSNKNRLYWYHQMVKGILVAVLLGFAWVIFSNIFHWAWWNPCRMDNVLRWNPKSSILFGRKNCGNIRNFSA